MLHNTGPYGPNDTPANMGAPLNMSQIGAMNMSHNINNLSKMPQQTPQSAAGSYSIPNFSPYAHAPMNMAPQMNQFPNYHSPPFQNSYIAPNSNILHESGWQNGMLPMNLNIQNDQAEAMGSYTNFDKRPSINDYKDMSQYRKAPINIPQVPTKAYHKHSGFNNDYNSFMYNDNSRQHVDYNIDLSVKTQERLEMDNTRRKSLENTVKLIENILINTTKNREMKLNQKSNDNMEKQDESTVNVNITKTNISENDTQGSEEQEDVDDEGNMSATEMEQEESSESEDDVKPSINVGETVNITRIEIEPDVTVKVEQLSSWVDLDNMQPYHRDVNGVSKEDVTGNSIIESEISVAEATEMIKNGSNTEAYLECPHCALVFKHCKRFLIHVKWHSFGLTNEKRMEMAREKEERKHMRKEARVIERMNAKEVTDPSSVGKVFPCKDCDKIFSVKSSLKNHRQRYHATRARECKICRKTVLGWMAHRAHLATHTGVSGYQCSECPKKFKYPHSLAKHRDTHLEKTHACQECPKKFGSQALLKMHMKCHERVLRGATFRCTYCGKGFFESYNLQVHERTHRNERPFHCDICNTSFGTNSSLKRHIKVSHSTSKPHACPTCHRSFVSALILERHERRAHGDPEDFKFVCSQCPCRYLKLKDLQKHVYKVHPKGKRKKKDKSDTE